MPHREGRAETLVFTPPPGWPVPPAGWTPPTGWEPDASWPEPPAGWRLWTLDGTQAPGGDGTLPFGTPSGGPAPAYLVETSVAVPPTTRPRARRPARVGAWVVGSASLVAAITLVLLAGNARDSPTPHEAPAPSVETGVPAPEVPEPHRGGPP